MTAKKNFGMAKSNINKLSKQLDIKNAIKSVLGNRTSGNPHRITSQCWVSTPQIAADLSSKNIIGGNFNMGWDVMRNILPQE